MGFLNWGSNILGRFGFPTTIRPDVMKDGTIFYVLPGQTIELPFKTFFEIFIGIPHLRAVIERKASYFSNVNFYIKRTDTAEEEIDYDHPLNKILKNPNVFQSWRQMLYMISLYKSICGISFAFPGFGINKSPKYLAFLKPIDFQDFHIEQDRSRNTIEVSDKNEIIKWVIFYMNNGQTVRYDDVDQLIMFKDSFSSYIEVRSRMTSLTKPIENIYKCLVNRGILMDAKGGIGIISGAQKDGGTAVPMKPKDKKDINKQLDGYGLGIGKKPVIFTDVPLKYQPMVFPTKELMLFEEIVDDMNTICDVYGMARELFDGKSTYANKAEAETGTYNGTILSEWSDLFDTLNFELGLDKENRKLCMDYSHIKAMSENQVNVNQAEKTKSDMHLAELAAGVIDDNEYRQQMGYEA